MTSLGTLSHVQLQNSDYILTPTCRPDFAHLSNTIDKLPKKKGLSRSLSQSNNPSHLSRSAESVF